MNSKLLSKTLSGLIMLWIFSLSATPQNAIRERDITFHLGKVVINGEEVHDLNKQLFLLSIKQFPAKESKEGEVSGKKFDDKNNYTNTLGVDKKIEIIFFSDKRYFGQKSVVGDNFWCIASRFKVPEGSYNEIFIELDVEYHEKIPSTKDINSTRAQCKFTLKPIVKSLQQITVEKIKEFKTNNIPYKHQERETTTIPKELQKKINEKK